MLARNPFQQGKITIHSLKLQCNYSSLSSREVGIQFLSQLQGFFFGNVVLFQSFFDFLQNLFVFGVLVFCGFHNQIQMFLTIWLCGPSDVSSPWCLRSCGYPKFGPSFSWVGGRHLPFYQGFFLAGGGFPFLAGGWLPFYQGCFALTACCCFFRSSSLSWQLAFWHSPFQSPKHP